MKKQYSLALGGGAARGFIHIGVFKYMEENNMKISEVSGTSMGAIIGAMIALGKTSDEIIEFAHSINYLKLIDLDFGHGLLKGKKVYKKLEEMFGNINIEDLDIQLKIVATNILSGETCVFESGRIVEAIRASFSLPGVFIPHNINDASYVDGGITNNLPIDVLKGKHIIGVSALKKVTGPLNTKRTLFGIGFNKGFYNLNYQIMHRTILTMMRQNEERSLEKVKGDFIFIAPDFGKLDYYSFDKIEDFVQLGYKETNKVFSQNK